MLVAASAFRLSHRARGTIVKLFPHGPDARLRKRSDIAQCQSHGTKIHCKHFLILFVPSDASSSRLAIAVTTKLEPRANRRNLIKRRIREVFRSVRSQFVKPFDMVVVARRDVQSCDISDFRRELIGAWRGHRLLPKEETP